MGVPTPQCLKTQPSTDAVQSTPYTPDAAPGRGPGGNSFLGLGGPGLDTVWATVYVQINDENNPKSDTSYASVSMISGPE